MLDLPNTSGRISRRWLRRTIAASRGLSAYAITRLDWRKGENLTLIRQAKRQGYLINVAAPTEMAADQAMAAGVPVVLMVSPTDGRISWTTPAGYPVIACPNPDACRDCNLCHTRPSHLVLALPAR